MKATHIKIITGITWLVFISFNAISQQISQNAHFEINEKMKLTKNEVPKIVVKAFNNQYPNSNDEMWYKYHTIDYLFNWFDYDPYPSQEAPKNYVVAFIKDNTPYLAIYSKDGDRIATHRLILDAYIPSIIISNINNSKYKSWSIGKDKEEIFKDNDSDQLKVYKVDVSNGKEKHTLYFQADGKLLKDRKVS